MLARVGLLKSGNLMTWWKLERRLVSEQPPGLFTEHTDKFIVDDNDVESNDDAKSDMSLLSRSFLLRVNDRVRKIQDLCSEDAAQDSKKHSLIWECYCLPHWKHLYSWRRITQKFLHSIKNTGKHLNNETDVRQIWKVGEQSDDIYGVNTIDWKDSSWKYLSLVGDEEVISLSRRCMYSQILC